MSLKNPGFGEDDFPLTGTLNITSTPSGASSGLSITASQVGKPQVLRGYLAAFSIVIQPISNVNGIEDTYIGLRNWDADIGQDISDQHYYAHMDGYSNFNSTDPTEKLYLDYGCDWGLIKQADNSWTLYGSTEVAAMIWTYGQNHWPQLEGGSNNWTAYIWIHFTSSKRLAIPITVNEAWEAAHLTPGQTPINIGTYDYDRDSVW